MRQNHVGSFTAAHGAGRRRHAGEVAATAWQKKASTAPAQRPVSAIVRRKIAQARRHECGAAGKEGSVGFCNSAEHATRWRFFPLFCPQFMSSTVRRSIYFRLAAFETLAWL